MLYLVGPGAVRLVGPEPALHGRTRAARPARLPRGLPLDPRATSTGSGTPAPTRCRCRRSTRRPAAATPRSRAGVQRREDRRRPERDRRRAQARPLRLGRRSRRRRPGRLPDDGRRTPARRPRSSGSRSGRPRRASRRASTCRWRTATAGTTAGASTPRGGSSTTRPLPLHRRPRVPRPLVQPDGRRRAWFESHVGPTGCSTSQGARPATGATAIGQGGLRQRPLRLRAEHAARPRRPPGAATWPRSTARTPSAPRPRSTRPLGRAAGAYRVGPGASPRAGRERDGGAHRRRDRRPRDGRARFLGTLGPLRPADRRRLRRPDPAVHQPVRDDLPPRRAGRRRRRGGGRADAPDLVAPAEGDTTGTFLENISTSGGGRSSAPTRATATAGRPRRRAS